MRKLAVMGCLALAVSAGAAAPSAGSDAARIAASENAFAIDLYRRLAAEPGNRFFSPYSIHAALAMTYAGARNRTASQMADVLHLAGPAGGPHAAYGGLIAELNAGASRSYELVVADALFGQSGFPFLEPFRRTCLDSYGARLFDVDFSGASDAATRQINEWVARETRGRVRDLLAPGSLDAATRLVLANAVYFKGKWESRFAEASTRTAPFDLGTGRRVDVRFMNQTHGFGYSESADFQLLEMSYEGAELSMVVILPRRIDGLHALQAMLTEPGLRSWIDGARNREVAVSLPKLRLTASFDLGRTLAAMGMADAFSRQAADFSGMSDTGTLFIGAAVHKAYVDVNEEGTEAAAATGIGMVLASMPARPPSFVADHPFLFLIRHRASGAILFLGHVADPTRES